MFKSVAALGGKRWWKRGTLLVPLFAHLWATEPRVVRFVAAAFRRHMRVAVLALVAIVLAAIFEGGTMGILLLALETLASGAEGLAGSAGRLGRYAEAIVAQYGPETVFFLLIGLAIVMQLLRSGLQFGGDVATAHLRARLWGDVRDRVFRQFMKMSYADVSSYRIGDLASYTEQSHFIGLFVRELNTVASQSGLLLAYVGVLLWLSWSMTLVALVALVLLALLVGRAIKRIRRLAERFTASSVSLNERTMEYLEGLRVIRAFARVDYALDRVDSSLSESVRATRKGLIWKATITPLVQSATVVAVGGALVGSLLVFGEQIRDVIPSLAVFLLVLYRLIPRLGQISNGIARINSFMPPIERLADILRTDNKEYLVSGSRRFAGLRQGVEFRGVSLSYRASSRPAVRDVSFYLPRGRMVALVGESGAGKSTIADLLLRFYDPSDGEILIDGVDLRSFDLRSWRERLGVVSQDTFIFNASVRDNIAFGKLDADDEEIVRAAQAAQAHDFIARLTDGYDSELGDRGYRLSGGQRQRIAIARVLLRDPDILILDEATSDLDSHSEALIQDALAKLSSERTVISIAHRLSTVAMADEILVMADGAIVERGTHRELLSLGGRYAHLWTLQAKIEGRAEAAVGGSRGS